MTAVKFDTLKFVEKLRSAGVPEEQAKAISEAFRDARMGGELMRVKWMLGVIIAAEAMPWFVKLFT